jgi:hypothetical protein
MNSDRFRQEKCVSLVRDFGDCTTGSDVTIADNRGNSRIGIVKFCTIGRNL